ADSSLTRKYGGTGMGLALATELVELHGGKRGLTSDLGKGTTVEFTLPIESPYGPPLEKGDKEWVKGEVVEAGEWTKKLYSEAERSSFGLVQSGGEQIGEEIASSPLAPRNDRVPSPQSSPQRGEEEGEGDKQHRILIVEDNAEMRGFIKFELHKHYRILEAGDGQKGLERAAKELPDLIVSDIMMPGVDGYELARRIKADVHTQHIPVILLTAKAELADKIEGLGIGADDYLIKPFNPKELRARVKNLINVRSLQREIQLRSNELEKTLKQLQETQAELIHAEKMAALGQLVAGVAHEVNNPVSFAINSLLNVQKYVKRIRTLLDEYMGLSPSDKDRLEEFLSKVEKIKQEIYFPQLLQDLEKSLQIVHNGLDRTQNIVSDLKTFAQKDRGGFVQADIHVGIDSTLSLLKHELDGRIKVHRDYGPLSQIECMPGQINQVLMNVFHNAIGAMPNKGDIFIRTRQLNEHVEISIKDTGVGIAPEVKRKIFDPFFTTKEVGKGMGLGLSVSYRIIESHGGKIRVESDPGRGAEFIILLPLRQPASNVH
ncbi:MAG: response regulator, partial [Deltaproteobacteria bacterium]|nr:response regulator [Deltaproteobacteria bacterium]